MREPSVVSRTLAIWMMMGVCNLWGCEPTADSFSSRSVSLTHGSETTGFPEVVELSVGNQGTCTATLIAPALAVTAAHCAEAFSIQVQSGAELIPVVTARTDPRYDPFTGRFDVAVLLLARPVEGPFATWAAQAPAVGQEVVLVGFGRDEAGVGRKKRMGTGGIGTLDESEAVLVPAPSLPCFGDSGAPVFDVAGPERRLIGVVSSGDETCTTRAFATRSDALTDFLASSMTGLALPRGPGEACVLDDTCASRVCVLPADVPGRGYCSTECETDADCTSGMTCNASGGGARRCTLPLPSPGALDGPCTSDGDCSGGLCIDAGDSGPHCRIRCFPENARPCDSGRTCIAIPGASNLFSCELPAAVTPDATDSEGGGCHVARGPSSPLSWPAAWSVTMLLLLARRGRQVRAPRAHTGRAP